jgi:hypothetical protein
VRIVEKVQRETKKEANQKESLKEQQDEPFPKASQRGMFDYQTQMLVRGVNTFQ